MSLERKMRRHAARKMPVGTKVLVDYGEDELGRVYWRNRDEPNKAHGPFPSQAEAERDFVVTTYGEQCEVKPGGQWDPAWDRPQ